MTQVRLVQLGDALELAYGKNLPKKIRAAGNVPVYGSNGITGWHNAAYVNNPTVIVGRKGGAGIVHYVEQPCFPIDTTYFVRPRDNYIFDMRFVYYLLKHLDLSRLATATGVPGLTREDAYRERIRVPPLTEQHRVVDLLSRADGIVGLRRDAQKKTEELAPAVFLDMFGDPATNPKSWPVFQLGDVCDRITDGTHQSPPFTNAGIPFIFISNIVDGSLSLDTEKFISELTYIELTRRCPIERGDVLYSTVGSYGVPVKVDTDDRFAFQRHIAHIKPNRELLDTDFLVGMLSTPGLKLQAESAARGIAQKTVNLGEICKFRVVVPPLSEQQRFATKADAVRSITAQQAAATASAQYTFNTLLHRAFAG